MTLHSFSEDLGSLCRDRVKITGKLFLEYFLNEYGWVLPAVVLATLVGAGGIGTHGRNRCWVGDQMEARHLAANAHRSASDRP